MWIQFSACAAESADSTSDCTRDSEWWAVFLGRSVTWRGKHSHARVWAKRLKKGGWIKHLSGAVICDSCPWTFYPESTTSPQDILASLLAPLVSDRASKTRATCGPGCSSASRPFDLEESFSKTSQVTSRWGCSTSCPIWRAAVTERRGAVIRRRLAVHHTDASESSSSGWPTPTVTANQTAPSMQKHPGCRAFWPTPAAVDSNNQPTNSLHHQVWSRMTKSRPVRLNPDWVEMLMGFPVGWTDCGHSETQ